MIFWDRRLRVEDHVVTFIHRGAEADRKTVPCRSVVKVGRSWFLYLDDDRETLIPYHRILEVKNQVTGEVLWRKRMRTPSEEG